MSEPSTSSNDVDALFKVPLGEFTAARNALAAQLKKAGRQAEGDEVKALAKPSVSAWVVNQLYWRHRESFDRLIEAGDRLRRAQASRPTSEAGRAPIVARREAVTALANLAADMLREGNHGAARDLLRRVTSTLEALSSYGSRPDAPIAGRLTDDVELPGFEAVATFPFGSDERTTGETRRRAHSSAAEPTVRTLHPTRPLAKTERRDEKERKGLVAAAKTAVREAERALNVARKQAERAAAKLDTAASHAKVSDGQRAQIEKQLVQASKAADAAHQRANEAAATASEATRIAEAADQALEQARRHLGQVEGAD